MTGPTIGGSRFAGDDGSADAALAAALNTHAGPVEVCAALVTARLLVPVVATGGERAATMSTPLLVGTDGRRALPAFTGLAALTAWQADARPVPVLGPEAARATFDAEADLMVVDVAGPVSYLLDGARLRALAEGRGWVPVLDDPGVRAALAALLDPVAELAQWRLLPAEGADARLELDLAAGTVGDERAVAGALASRLAEDPVLRVRLERGLEVAIVPPEEGGPASNLPPATGPSGTPAR